MKRLRFKLTTRFILIIILILIVLGIYNAKILENTYIDTLSSRLEREATVIANTFNWDSVIKRDHSVLIQAATTWAKAGDARVTIIDLDGEVLADSEVHYTEMENHRTREEVAEALAGRTGTAIRHSHTTAKDTIYVAIPLKWEGKLIGVARLSYPIQLANAKVHQLWFGQVIALVIVFILFSFIGSRLARGISGPIEKITEAARNITRQKYDVKLDIKGSDEIAELSRVINYMSKSLEHQMKQIRENEKKLSDVLTNMFSGVILINQNGEIVLTNHSINHILHVPSSEWVGKAYSDVMKNSDLKKWIDEVLRNKGSIRRELHLYTPEEKNIDTSLASLVDDLGQMVGVVIVLHDITEIRRLEKIRSDFVANASHELKTPVTSIRGFTETLLDGAMYEQEVLQSFLQIIYKESERLQRLIEDILDLSKIEQKRLVLDLHPCQVSDLVDELILGFQSDLERKQIIFNNEIPKSLMIHVDVDRLRQIFINLIANAIQYTPEKGMIWTEAVETDEYVTLAVCDTGVGIPQQHIKRIFERFYRVDKARSRDSGGTGLGLAIVKHLVESHHGHIWVESEEGKGSRFIIELPKQQAPYSS